MLNILIFVCCVLGGLLLGVYFRKRALQKQQLYTDLMRYISALQLNVSGKQLEISDFNANFALSCSEIFTEALLHGKYPSQLSTLQKKELDDFFGNLDCISSGALLEHLRLFQKRFEPMQSETADAAKKSSLHIKLGLLLGVMVGILFI